MFPQILIIVLILGMFLLFGISCKKSGNNSPVKTDNTPPTKTYEQITEENIYDVSFETIEAMLERLESRKAPKPKPSGAMCYSIAPGPDRAEYVCPVCNEKTIYEKWEKVSLVEDLEAARREFQQLQGVTVLNMRMDEKGYCLNCSPDVNEPALSLEITYDDGRSKKTSPVTYFDLLILRYFLKGELSYRTGADNEFPLKDYIDRIRELLDVSQVKIEGVE